MNPLAPAPESVARFRRDLEALIGEPAALGVAVSGGPDSLALLLLAQAALPDRIHAATVDHGLRPESAAEARAVAAVCERIGCPHITLTVEVSSGGDGLQAEARRARYRALIQWAGARSLTAIATAHHLDDQAETLLMRLQRGAGVAGLAGIPPVRREGALRILRPLLGWTKDELVEILATAGLDPSNDPSNRDPRFDRTAVRDLLANLPQLAPSALARSATALREAEEALAWTTDDLWLIRVRCDADALLLDPKDLPPELRRRLAMRILEELAPGARPRGEEVSRLLNALDRGETVTLAGLKASGGNVWRFGHAPPRRIR